MDYHFIVEEYYGRNEVVNKPLTLAESEYTKVIKEKTKNMGYEEIIDCLIKQIADNLEKMNNQSFHYIICPNAKKEKMVVRGNFTIKNNKISKVETVFLNDSKI